MRHLGDITKIHGYDITPVDVITGGSPCQDLPYCWERCNGKGTAIWASEIEEFPIAVTKRHFPEGSEIE